MKKLLSMVTLLSFLLIANMASATVYEETIELDKWLAEGPIAEWLADEIGYTPSTTMPYSHSTPSQFEIPYDIVTSATLTINAYYVDGTFIHDDSNWRPWVGETVPNDQVVVKGTIVGALNLGGSYESWDWDEWTWVEDDDPSITSFNITSVFGNWPNGTGLDVAINASGGLLEGALYLDKSVFTLDYEDGTAPAAVPEPATMLLFGIGLLGLAGVNRRKHV